MILKIFNKIKNLNKSKNVNNVVSAMSYFLVDDSKSGYETPFKEFLKVHKLNYSHESLRYVDDYLIEVKKRSKSLTDEAFTKVILRCGSYCGEVIRTQSKNTFNWITYDDLPNKHILSEFPKSPLTYYILTNKKLTTCPMAKVEKFLTFGKEESLYSYAKAIQFVSNS